MKFRGILASVLLGLVPCGVHANAEPWQVGFQEAVTPIMETVHQFHNLLLIIMSGVVLTVFLLLLYVIFRYNARANPVPSNTTHNTLIEIVWTAIPLIILMVIGIPSIKLIYYSDTVEEPEMTIKAIGHQWYWSYSYPKEDIEFDSRMIPDKDIDLSKNQMRLLSVDEPIYIPVDTTVRILTTSEDVLHSFAVPSFGVKRDSVPGKLNEMWVKVNKEGTYYGQCSELCGMQHGFMPIEVRVVSKEAYAQWLKQAKEKYS